MRPSGSLNALIGEVTLGGLLMSWWLSTALLAHGRQRDLARPSNGAQLSSQARPVGGGTEAPSCTLNQLQRQTSALARASSTTDLSPDDVLRELATQRRKWAMQQPASYRLCVITVNPLLYTVREVDVEHGKIRVAREAQGMAAVDGRLDARAWSPSRGLTVEDLFDEIQRGLTQPAALARSNGIRFVVIPTYDSQTGYPIRFYSGPDQASLGRVFDADVDTLISLTPLPTVGLEPVSAGDVYNPPKRGRILRPLSVYFTLLGFLSPDHDDRIRSLWPGLAPLILKRGNNGYWREVNWAPQRDMVGRILGTFKHVSGRSLYLMAISHNGEDLYLPIEMSAVEMVE
jgi:hypothetical protein